jgi:hypothetical protein
MPIEYILLVIGNDYIKRNLVKVLTSKVSELEKLQENILQSKVKFRMQQWNMALWSQHKIQKTTSNLVILFCGFQKVVHHILGNY